MGGTWRVGPQPGVSPMGWGKLRHGKRGRGGERGKCLDVGGRRKEDVREGGEGDAGMRRGIKVRDGGRRAAWSAFPAFLSSRCPLVGNAVPSLSFLRVPLPPPPLGGGPAAPSLPPHPSVSPGGDIPGDDTVRLWGGGGGGDTECQAQPPTGGSGGAGGKGAGLGALFLTPLLGGLDATQTDRKQGVRGGARRELGGTKGSNPTHLLGRCWRSLNHPPRPTPHPAVPQSPPPRSSAFVRQVALQPPNAAPSAPTPPRSRSPAPVLSLSPTLPVSALCRSPFPFPNLFLPANTAPSLFLPSSPAQTLSLSPVLSLCPHP